MSDPSSSVEKISNEAVEKLMAVIAESEVRSKDLRVQRDQLREKVKPTLQEIRELDIKIAMIEGPEAPRARHVLQTMKQAEMRLRQQLRGNEG